MLSAAKEKRQHGSMQVPYSYYDCRMPDYFPGVPLHWHGEMELNYIKRGTGYFQYEDRLLTAHAGDIFLIQSNLVHAILPAEQKSMFYDTIVFHQNMLIGGYVLGFGPYGGGGGGGGGTWIGGAKGGAGGGGNGGTGGTDGVDGGYGHPGQANTGGGAGGPGGGYEEGTMGGEAAAGGSGIVILRGTQDDLLPVFFNGVQLSEIWLNGVKAGGLIRDGVRVFTRRMKACFA